MNAEKITSSLGVNLEDSIAKIDKIMEQKQDVKHDNMEDMIIEFTNDLAENLTPKEIALILAIKTVESVVEEQAMGFLKMVMGAAAQQNRPNDGSNPLGSKLGF